MKLAKVSPKLRAAFRKGDLTLEQIMAFAISDDHDLQEDVFKNQQHWNRSPRDIRAALTQQAIALTQPLAKFVTVEAYVAAGGVIQRDLFDEANEGFMPDRVLAVRLAMEKLDAAVEAVSAEGWKWVKTEVERDYSIHYGRVYPTYEATDGDEDGELTPQYDADDVARAGAVLRVGYDGELSVERGLVHPDDRVAETRAGTARKVKVPGELSATLIRELSAHRTAALQAAMAQNPAVVDIGSILPKCAV